MAADHTEWRRRWLWQWSLMNVSAGVMLASAACVVAADTGFPWALLYTGDMAPTAPALCLVIHVTYSVASVAAWAVYLACCLRRGWTRLRLSLLVMPLIVVAAGAYIAPVFG